jgi:hypothetical protein
LRARTKSQRMRDSAVMGSHDRARRRSVAVAGGSPIAEDVVLLSDYVAEVHPNAESDALVFGRFGIALSHPALDLDGTAHSINNARKLSKETVAGILDDAAAVLRDLRVDQLLEMRLQPLVRPLLIRAHQARIAGHVGG